MSNRDQGLRRDEQPGLEIDARIDTTGLHPDVYAGDTTKQVVPEGQYFPDERYASPGLQAVPKGKDEGAESAFARGGTHEKETATPTKKPRLRPWWIALGAAAIVIIIGAVLGGVLGSQAANSSSTIDNGRANTSDAVLPLNNILKGSKLAVTGWGNSSTYHIRLFYQGPDQHLRYSHFSSAGSGWNNMSTFLNLMPDRAGVNTSLAAATSLEVPSEAQYNLWFVDHTSTVRIRTFPYDLPNPGRPNGGSFNEYPLSATLTSRLAAYWPFLASQDANGNVRWTRYLGPKPSPESDQAVWQNDTSGIMASRGSGVIGSGLAVVPAAARHNNAGAFFYRRNTGKVYNYLEERRGNTTGTAWASGNLTTDVPSDFIVPPESPIAAFTVARAAPDNGDLVNTYVLYQNSQREIGMLWQDADGTAWKGPRMYPAAFGGADGDTDIACLTPATWDAPGVDTLPSSYAMSRCYFQAEGGRVREVQFDGGDWKSLGYVPIS